MISRLTPPIVDTYAALAQLIKDLSSCKVIAVDTEMDSYYHYYEKVCLVQLSTDQADYLIDPLHLDLSSLNSIFSADDCVCIFHAGSNDVPYLYRDHRLVFKNIFDTYVAAELLQLPSKGLAGLIKQYFDVDVDKKYQRADWTIRPLSADMDNYARGDTRYLIELRAILLEELKKKNLLTAAQRSFAGISKVRIHPKEFSVDNWIHIKNVRDLSPDSYGVIRRLYVWREQLAKRLDISVFRVLPDYVLVALAQQKPLNSESLEKHFSNWKLWEKIKSFQNGILEAVRQGKDDGKVTWPKKRSKGNKFTDRQVKIYNNLRRWRNQLCEAGEISTSIFSNKMLGLLVESEPRTLEELERLEVATPEFLHEHSAELLNLIHSS
ncbi:ribonuclease D [bacterium]|nr:ribonuclease D [bacterium]